MRAFRHARDAHRELLELHFPMLQEDEWCDSPALTYRAISIWDHWLCTTDEAHLLNNVSPEEQRVRDDKFRNFHRLLIENVVIFNATFSRRLRFRETRCKRELHWRLDPAYPKSSALLLLPEIRAIYTYAGDHTSVLWSQEDSLLPRVDTWLEQSGLTYVR